MKVGTLLNRVFEVALTSTVVSDFFMPRDYSRGGGIKICPCLSVCLSVRSSRFTVYSLCNQLFPQFSMGLLKPCILFADIMKMCMWSFGGRKLILTELRLLNLLIFWQLLHYGVGTL